MNPLPILVLLLTAAWAAAFDLPANCKQAVVGVTPSWDSSRIAVSLYEKQGRQWRRVAGPWNGRCGRDGLAWGRGLHPAPGNGARLKREGDWRAPAGVFKIGGAWGYHPDITRHPKLFYRQVTTRDLWYEDPRSSFYNQWRVLKQEPSTAAEKKAQMKQDDYPHSLKLFIAHNAPPRAVPGAGSAIFFHIWRGGGAKPTSGCTTLPEKDLRALIARIDPARNPLYILLPEAEYARLRDDWKLP
ncbi:MAG: L,D-transpeptidase family protein [Akkermansiaceae bacterium]|nr:L,D-transpeptidase family protein [Akkermansiaceae bacterium]NNM29638.1 L,D-transpeptidase family protein [Akkermansiaceae bacterium]